MAIDKIPGAFDLSRKVMDVDKFQALRNAIYADTVYWFDQAGEPIKLGFISMRYAKKARKLGVSLLELIGSDARLSYRRNKRGAYLIAPYEKAKEIYGEELTNFWSSFGVPMY